jgi:hypothetical protein
MFFEGKSVQKSVGKNQTMEPLYTLLLGLDLDLDLDCERQICFVRRDIVHISPTFILHI